jgi:uncharacterized protein (TIGR03086 family)
MDNLTLLQRVVDQTNGVVGHISPDQLSASTLCSEWTVRDVINHMTGGATMFAISAEEGAVPDEQLGQLMGGDNLGDDYKGALEAAMARALAAFTQPGALDKTVKLPFGEMPGGIALNIAVFDVATHSVDLARATGQHVDDVELLESALTIGKQMIGPDLRAPGVFDEAKAIADDASIEDRLLAFAGRTI